MSPRFHRRFTDPLFHRLDSTLVDPVRTDLSELRQQLGGEGTPVGQRLIAVESAVDDLRARLRETECEQSALGQRVAALEALASGASADFADRVKTLGLEMRVASRAIADLRGRLDELGDDPAERPEQ